MPDPQDDDRDAVAALGTPKTANPWDGDPIVQPAGKAAGNPWDNDPIITPAPKPTPQTPSADDTAASMQAHAIHEVKYGDPLPEADSPSESDSMAPSLLTGEQIPEGQYNQELAKYSKYQNWIDRSGQKDDPALMKQYFNTYDAENQRQSENNPAAKPPTPEELQHAREIQRSYGAPGVQALPGGQYAVPRALYSTGAQIGGSALGLGSRVLTMFDPSYKNLTDSINRTTAKEAGETAQADKSSSLPSWLLSGTRGAGQAVFTGMVSGPAAPLIFASDAMNKAETRADDAGLAGPDKDRYIATEGMINAALAAVFGKMQAKLGGTVPIGTFQREAVEAIGSAAGAGGLNVASAFNDVDPNKKVTLGEAAERFRDGAVMGLIAHAGGTLSAKAADTMRNMPIDLDGLTKAANKSQPDPRAWAEANPDGAQKLAGVDEPSRKDLQDAGVSTKMTAKERTAFADQVRQQIQGIKGPPDLSTISPDVLDKAKLPDLNAEVTQRMKDAGQSEPNKAGINDDYLNGKPPIEHATDVAVDHVTDNQSHSAFLVETDTKNQKGLNDHFGAPAAADKGALRPWSQISREELAKLGGSLISVKSGGDEQSHVIVFDHKVDPADVRGAIDQAGQRIDDHAKAQGIPDDLENPRAPNPGNVFDRAEMSPKNQAAFDAKYQEYIESRGTGIRSGVTELKPGDDYAKATDRANIELLLKKKGMTNELQELAAKDRAESVRQQPGGADAGAPEAGAANGGQPVDRANLDQRQQQPDNAGGPNQPGGGVGPRGVAATGTVDAANARSAGAGGQGLQPAEQEPVQPSGGNPAESANSAGDQAAQERSHETAESLSGKSFEHIKNRLADEFGVRGMLSKSQAIKEYLKQQDAANIVSMGAAMGPGFDGNEGRGIIDALKRLPKDAYDAVLGNDHPQTDRRSRPVAEKMAALAASQTAGREIAKNIVLKVTGGDVDLGNRLGAVLVENRLRGEQDRLAAQKDPAAANVQTMVGPNKLWETEADYQKEKSSPEIQNAIKKYNAEIAPVLNGQYRATAGLKESDPVPFHGRDFEAPVNLLANAHAEQALGRTPGGTNLNNPRANYNPNRMRATGAAESGYTTNLNDMVEHSVTGNYEKAKRLELFKSMVDEELGQYAQKGQPPPAEINGEKTAHMKVDLPVAGTRSMESKELYYPKAMQSEMEQALNARRAPPPNAAAQILNGVQRAGVVDAAAHVKNMWDSVRNALSGSALKDLTVRGIPGIRALDTGFRFLSKAVEISQAKPEMQAALAEVARVGALRPESPDAGFVGKFIHAGDKAARLILNDFYNESVKNGDLKMSDTDRREFINKAMGQYNPRAQGAFMADLKSYGVAPYVVAAKTMGLRAAKTLTGSYGGAEATSVLVAAKLRSIQLARNFAMTIAAGAIGSYVLNGKGPRAGVPIGGIDTGKDDKDGKPVYVDTMGAERRGLGNTGVGAVVEGIRRGQQPGLTADAAGRDIINHNLHIAVGPVGQFASEGLLGKRLGLGEPAMPAADRSKGETQVGKNLTTATEDLNPILGGAIKGLTGKPPEGSTRIGETQDKTFEGSKKFVENFIGIKSGKTPMGPATEYANALYHQRVGDKQYTDDQQAAHDARTQITKDVRSGVSKDAAMAKAVDSGLVTPKEALASAKGGAKDYGVSLFGKLTPEEIHQVIKSGVGTDEEKQELQAALDKKVKALQKTANAPYSLRIKDRDAWKANKETAKERLAKLISPSQ